MSHTDYCARCGVNLVEHESGVDGTPVYIDTDGSYCCTGWHGHDEHGVYAPNHTLDPDEDTLAVLDFADNCRPTEDGDWDQVAVAAPLDVRAAPLSSEQRHPNFHLWEVIDGLLQLHDTPADDRECAWCDKPAVILLPASRNDNAWPQLTQRACFDHSGLDQLVNGQDGTAPYVTEYLNHFETEETP